MAWNGSGTFSRTNGTNTGSTLWASDRDDGTKITAARHDTHDQDLADGINNALAKDGQNAMTGALDMNGNELVLDVDGDTSITADTDDQIDIRVAGADDFQITANTFSVLSGSTLDGTPGTVDVTDSRFSIKDEADATKVAKFQASGITTGTTRTYTLPDADSTLMGGLVDDTTPQLGGQLDVNGNAIGDGTRELLTFVEDASAVNNVEIENEATGSGPIIRAVGDDANVDLNYETKGDGVHSFTGAAHGAITTLSDGATITPDFADSNDFTVTLGGNRTLANPTNITAGQSGSIYVVQDGTGSRTLSFGSYWDFAGGTAPTMTTTASAVDRIDYIVRTTTSIHAVVSLEYS